MSDRCGFRHGRNASIQCTRELGHPGCHQYGSGPYWPSHLGTGRCLYVRKSDGARCARHRHHWEDHLDIMAYPFSREEAKQVLRDHKPDVTLVDLLREIDVGWPMSLWQRLRSA